jgi:hypothetical protein
MATNIPNIYGANDNEWNVGPAGVGGAVGSTYHNTTTGNLSVCTPTGGWVTTGSSGATGSLWSIAPTYVSTGTYTINATSSVYSNGVDYSNNDIILKRNGKDDLHVGKAIDAIMERLCIIEPAFELLEKYPALREAYNNYKLIETMVKNGDHDDE